MSTAVAPARLTADIRVVDSKWLEIRYHLTNVSSMDLCVFNKFYRTKPSGERELNETGAYVLFEEARTIHVTRSTIDVPPGLKVEYPEVPYATILASKKAIEETVRVAVPVQEAHPYREPLEQGAGREHVFTRVYFSIGVIERSANLKLRRLPHVGDGVYAVEYSDAVTQQQLIESPPANLVVPVRIGDGNTNR